MDINDLRESNRTDANGNRLYEDNAGGFHTISTSGAIHDAQPADDTPAPFLESGGLEHAILGCAVVACILGAAAFVVFYAMMAAGVLVFIGMLLFLLYRLFRGIVFIPWKYRKMRQELSIAGHGCSPNGVLCIWHDHCRLIRMGDEMLDARMNQIRNANPILAKKTPSFPNLRKATFWAGAAFSSCIHMAFCLLSSTIQNLIRPRRETAFAGTAEVRAFYEKEGTFWRTFWVHRFYLETAFLTAIAWFLGLSFFLPIPIILCAMTACWISAIYHKRSREHLGRGLMAAGYAFFYPLFIGMVVPLIPSDIILVAAFGLPLVLLFLSIYARPAGLPTKITVFLFYGAILAALGVLAFKVRIPLDHSMSVVPCIQKSLEQAAVVIKEHLP